MKEHSIVHDLLVLAAADALTPAEQRRVERHLEHCEECSAEYDDWIRITGALKVLPTPQAPPKLTQQTRRLLEIWAAAGRKHPGNWTLPAFLVLVSWIVTVLNWRLLIPLAEWFDVSSPTLWVTYIAMTWLTAAVAAGLLVKNSQQEGKAI